MPTEIPEFVVMDRTVGPAADPLEIGRRIADLFARVDALQKVIVVEGQSVTIQADRVSIKAVDEVQIQTVATSIKMDAAGIAILASGSLRCSTAAYALDASQASFNTSIGTFGGVLKADTMITNTITAAVYTPGVGNIF